MYVCLLSDPLEIDDNSDSGLGPKYWIPSLQLLMFDYEALVGGRWLTDNIINAVQKLLKDSYPFIGGLQVTTLAEVLAFKVEKGEFVQVLNVDNSHWITCSTVGCKRGEVNVFVSMLGHDLPDRTKEQIASYRQMLQTGEQERF